MAIVGFDQDPELPYGAGLFHSDDGRRQFGHDPALADMVKEQQARWRQHADAQGYDPAGRQYGKNGAMQTYGVPNEDDVPPEGFDSLSPGGGYHYTKDPEGQDQYVEDQVNWDNVDLEAAIRGDGDRRTAGIADRADIDAITRDLAGGQTRAVMPPTATDTAPAGSDQAKVQNALFRSEAPPQAQQQAPAQPASPALGQAEALQQNVDAYVPQYKRVAPQRGGVVPVTQSEVRETQGIPYDPNGPEAQARAGASINVNLAGQAKAQTEALRAQGEMAAYQAALPQIQEQARIAEMRRDMQERQYRRDRDDLERAVEESNQSAKSFNANRWFDDRGAIGSIGAAIAQAFGASGAALTGGPNVVLQQINSYIDRDVATQRAQIEAGKENANSALAKLNRQYGNLDQAEAALRIAQQKKAENMAGAFAASTKSKDVMNALDVWLADNEQRRVKDEQAFQNASYGKTALTTGAKVIPSTRGGTVPLTEKEKQEYYNTLEKRNQVIGGTYKTEQERQKAYNPDTEKTEKQERRLIENLDGSQVMAKSPEEADKIRKNKALHASATREFGQIKKIAQDAITGGRVGEARGRIKVLMKRGLENVNTVAGQGIYRTDDDIYYTDALFGPGGGLRTEVLDELIGTADHEYQAQVDAQRGSAVKVRETETGQKVGYTGKASKTPTKQVPVLRTVGTK